MSETEEFEAGPVRKSAPATHPRLVFALIIVAVFLDVVDYSIVQVALPTIRDQFSVSLADSQWIIGAYGLTMAGFLMLSGRAGDIYGQKKLFVTGIVLFTLSSLSGGLAPSLLVLIIARAAQGIGAAISTVTAFSIFIAIFPEGQERNRALGIIVAVLSAGFAAGSIAGGVLTATLGWRSVLFVNVPIGAIGAVLSAKYLPGGRGRLLDGHLDLPGALTVTSGLIFLVYGLTNASTVGFDSVQTAASLAISLILLAAFVAVELRSHSPLMPFSFLRRGSVLDANVLGLILSSIMGGLGFILTIYLQQILGYSALQAGLEFLPPAIIFFVLGGWGSSRLVWRFGLTKVLVGSSASIVAGCILLTQISVTGNYYGVLPGMLLWSIGASVGLPALSIAAIAGTRPGEEGLASGLISTSQRIGMPLGLGILLTIASVTDPQPTGSTSQLASAVATVNGFHLAFLASAIVGLVAVAIAFRIKNVKPQTMEDSQQMPPM
jgi:EmrB/QacA subfamily drug resistance transporter